MNRRLVGSTLKPQMVTLVAALLVGAPLQVQPPEREATRANLWIDAVAVDRQGAPVMDLRPSEFEVWISGYRVPIVDVFAATPAGSSRSVVLLLDDAAIDHTAAMRVQEAARLFVHGMGPSDRLAVVTLHGGNVETTDDRSTLLRTIDAYRVQGVPFRVEHAGEHVLSRLESLSRQFPETAERRKTIVAIGAGWLFDRPLPVAGLRDLRREWVSAMRAMAATNTSLYVIDPAGLGVAPGSGAYGGDSGFARETGGHAFMNTNDIRGVVARIWGEAGSYYVLGVVDPPVQRNADLRELDVKVLRKDITVRARRGIKGRP